jgi:folate-binding protein YgfZ
VLVNCRQIRVAMLNEGTQYQVQLQHAATTVPTDSIVLRAFIHVVIIGADKHRSSTYHAVVPNYFTQIRSRGALSISGVDAHKFLQGQTTCDTNLLSQALSVPGAYCNPQGRLICDFRLLQIDDDTLLQMPRELCQLTADVLQKYIVFSKAELAIASDKWVSFAVWGESAAVALDWLDGSENQARTTAVANWVQIDSAGTRFEATVRSGAIAELETFLGASFEPVPEAAWQLQEIAAGLAHVEAATSAEFLPHMLNYQATGRINFKKGCYPGQEVVARMHYRGKTKRRVYRAGVSTAQAPAAGSAVVSSDNNKVVGTVVNAAAANNRVELLVILPVDAVADQAKLQLADNDAAGLEILPLPYSLES